MHKTNEILNNFDLHRSVLESMKDGIYICSPDHLIIYMNTAMIKKTGYDAIGELCYKAIYNKNEECPWCVADRIMKGEHVEYELLDPIDNNYYSVSNSPIFNCKEVLYKLSVYRDITKKKALETQHIKKRKMESITTLIGGIAHNFNNLLYIMIGNAELVLEDIPKSNPSYMNIKNIISAGLKGAGIVKELLNFCRKNDVLLHGIDAVSAIRNSLNIICPTIPPDIEIRININPQKIIILADESQIHQLFLNICTNAVQAMEDTGGILEINVEKAILTGDSACNYPEVSPGRYLKISISDTGPGIEPEFINKIFIPYYTTREFGTTPGMGLSIVHGIVKNLNGEVFVDSQVEKGSTFTFLFPEIIEA